jgi:5-hydroxyisourate hydrolase
MTMARLSTHVLDTSLGLPASGLGVDLFFLNNGGERRLLVTTVTNGQGRTDAPLLETARLEIGVYELLFRAGAYFRRTTPTVPDPPFLGDIVVRFGIADPTGHYHVPLLLSPYGYSVYRGS